MILVARTTHVLIALTLCLFLNRTLFLWILVGLVCTVLLFYHAEERITKNETDQNIGLALVSADNYQRTGNKKKEIVLKLLFVFVFVFAFEVNRNRMHT